MQREITNALRPILSNFFENTKYSETTPTGEEFSTQNLQDLRIIPDTDGNNYGPWITGNWRDTPYRLTKASFYNNRRDSDGDSKKVYQFSGIILEIDCTNEMPTIVFYPDFGETMNKVYGWATARNRPAHRLAFPDPAIEDVFEVYTNDVEAAKASLNPDFGIKLLAFARQYQQGKKHVAAAFSGRKFYMAVDLSHDFMNFDVGKRPLYEADSAIHTALSDLMIPRKIIDTLLD